MTKNKDLVSKDTHFRGFIEDAYANFLEYNADLLRIVSVNLMSDTTDIVIAPLKVDKESIDELVLTISDAVDEFCFTLSDDDGISDVNVSWTLNGTEFAKKSKDKYAEPRDYNILGVELKYDKENNNFITPNGEQHSPLDDYGLSSVNILADEKGLPCLQELYNYVVNYKLDKLVTDPLRTTQSPMGNYSND